MLDIKQSRDHVAKRRIYHLICHMLLRERQLKFTGHCIRMPTDERANHFVIYESKTRSSLRPGAPRTTYLHKISSHIIYGTNFLSCLRRKNLYTDHFSPNDDDDETEFEFYFKLSFFLSGH